MSDTTEFSERETIEMLLPWYAMGTLEPDDRAKVDAYLASHPDMRVQPEMIEAERIGAIETNEAIPVPVSLSIERLLAEAKPSTAKQLRASAAAHLDAGRQSIWQALGHLFTAPTPKAVRFAGAAAVALVLAQAIAIGSLMNASDPAGPGQSGGYELASGDEKVATTGTTALLRVKPDATFDQIATDLGALDLTIVDGPKGGFLTVRIGPKTMTKEAVTNRLEAIRRDGKTVLLIVATGQ